MFENIREYHKTIYSLVELTLKDMYSANEAAVFIANALDESSDELSEDISEQNDQTIAPFPDESECSLSEVENKLSDVITSKDRLFDYSETARTSMRRVSAVNTFTAKHDVPKNVASAISTPLDSLKMFITPNILEQIIVSTNSVLSSPIDENNLWLWIGANLFLGISKSKNASVEEMFSKEFGLPYLRSRNLDCHISDRVIFLFLTVII